MRDDDRLLPLNVVRDSFAALSADPDPLSIDGGDVAGFPDRVLGLGEVRDLLLDRGCSGRTRDQVWRVLIRRARSEGACWTLACAGVALPALAASTHRLGAWHAGDHADLQSAILMGFLEALSAIDLAQDGLMDRLRWAAHRAGRAAVVTSLEDPRPFEFDQLPEVTEAILTGFRSVIPKPPWGHPDLVLARAVADGVLTPAEAELIGATRLDEVGLAAWAEAKGVKRFTAYSARWRAEKRLVSYLTAGARDADPDDEVMPAVETAVALQQPSRTPDKCPDESRAVSGRRRNGDEPRRRDRSPSVKNFDPKSGLFRCRGFAPRTRPSSPGPDSEDRRCA